MKEITKIDFRRLNTLGAEEEREKIAHGKFLAWSRFFSQPFKQPIE